MIYVVWFSVFSRFTSCVGRAFDTLRVLAFGDFSNENFAFFFPAYKMIFYFTGLSQMVGNRENSIANYCQFIFVDMAKISS